MDSRRLPVIDKLNGENFTGLVGTPEGRLIVAILLQAIDDLDFELKNRFPLDTLPWFYSDSRVLFLACSLLEWDVRSLRERIEERVNKAKEEMKEEIKDAKGRNRHVVRRARTASSRALKGAVRDTNKKRAAGVRRGRTKSK